MKTYAFGFTILLAACLYFLTGCAHKPLAATTYHAHPAKPALGAARPQFLPVKRFASKPVKVDTVHDTLWLPAKITTKKHPKRPCKG